MSLQQFRDPALPFLHGVLRDSFPRFSGLMEDSDFLSPIPLRFVSFGSAVLLAAPDFALLRQEPRRRSLGYLFAGLPDRPLRGETTGSPKVPGQPLCSHALFSDPGGTPRPGHTASRCCLPLQLQRRLPASYSLSGLNRTACSLAVYASQGGSPLHHARLASGCGPHFAGQDCFLRGYCEKFQCLIHFLFSQAFPGAKLESA